MRKLTVLAAAFAAGLTSFAANSAPHPGHSLRGEGADSAPAAKAQDNSVAKDKKQQGKATARTETRPAGTRQPKKANTEPGTVKTPLFIVTNEAGENKPAAEKQPKGRHVAEKSTQKKRVVEKAESKKKRVAKKAEPKRTRVASKSESKAKQTAEKSTPKAKKAAEKSAPKLDEVVAVRPTPRPEQVAEKSAPKAKKVAERKTSKAKKVAEKSPAKPQDGGDRLVAVKESVALDLVETASIGSKGAKTMKGAGGRFAEIIAKYAASYGVPVSLAHAVIQVESNYRPDAKGSAGEIGLMQIKPATARMMGYEGSTQGLFHPETNIKYGMKYLAKAQKVGDGTTCGTILKYNAGHAAKRMNPVSSAYCVKVKRFLGV
ncbi:lytic transglycosylase domain-containing protein [Allomesorhizobium alhagi]|jgi:soluble lytic murein transglycosylase-like protein|uniref:Transglycosylase n=1 Tax=Mesorhizobium alhagi CCNWXJ12-2 TaxID=1107882 RepID=H0HTJ3_9HYPH|nr:transglycosylase [Mesorhizobium alhagi CCNWXJ12-2]